jgi:hypothetical protein
MTIANDIEALRNNFIDTYYQVNNANFTGIVHMEEWFADCAKRLHVVVEKISAAESKDWQMVYTEDGKQDYIAHSSGRIHKIVFLRVWEPLRNQWVDRCLLEPIAEGSDGAFSIILLVTHEDKYLVQAKGEPGNDTPYHVVLTPTVQTSFVNLDMKLSGNVYFAELYNHPECRKLRSIQDGGQLFNKIAELCVLDLKEKPSEIPADFYWATLEEIKYFAQKKLVSEHLIQTLGVLYLGC